MNKLKWPIASSVLLLTTSELIGCNRMNIVEEVVKE